MDSLKNLSFRNKSKQKKKKKELQGSSSAKIFIQLFIMYPNLFDIWCLMSHFLLDTFNFLIYSPINILL